MNYLKGAIRAALCGAAFTSVAAGQAAIAGENKPYKIFLSMSYVGNDWQAQAQNMVTAMAKAHPKEVDLQIQVAGPVAQKQIQQINAMVQAGADAIIVYPISPTALNSAIKNACSKGVKVFAYDSSVTEECAYNVVTDQAALATESAEWVAKKMGGKGNLLFMTGVPGTSVDKTRNEAARAVFAKYPDIKIVAEPNGMWSQAIARKALTEVMSTMSWENIQGVWGATACVQTWSLQIEAGLKSLVPCGAEGTNGMRVMMLPEGAIEGAAPPYAPMSAPGISLESHPGAGAMALKLALDALEGKDVPKTTLMPLEAVTSENAKLCKTGSFEELSNGCNVFDPGLVPSGWFANIANTATPEIGFQAALVGQPEAVAP
ncbi:sugar ABC transporter substrate-binding protein [Agrobacterium fabacearum]|uniref:sugar ABC transporter substrate-binding protein n=1 Tax=Agrobacterium tumefaciens TaxID=358 RepID=UPI0028536109|nr:sugar ABC transporter substrate-binding protein [Agrobacterium tumefaciens]MDR5012558.1 sugar ABC transporter substrate-binding protein [Agrobacterium tumefaciens]